MLIWDNAHINSLYDHIYIILKREKVCFARLSIGIFHDCSSYIKRWGKRRDIDKQERKKEGKDELRDVIDFFFWSKVFDFLNTMTKAFGGGNKKLKSESIVGRMEGILCIVWYKMGSPCAMKQIIHAYGKCTHERCELVALIVLLLKFYLC